MRLLVRTITIVAVCEFIIMNVLSLVKIENLFLEALLDTIALSIMVTPLMWFLVIKNFKDERDFAVKQLQDNYETMIHVSKMTTLGEISKGLAHEINNPLQIIIGAGQVLAKTPDEKIVHWGNRISEAGRRISKILKGLLIFTGVEGANKGRKRRVKEIILDFQEFIMPRMEEFNILFKVTIECKDELEFDEASIFHILTNLAQNAIEAIGYERPVIELKVKCEQNTLLITFSDNGRGIDSQIGDKIFDPFFTTKEAGKGTGLGLTLVKGIVSRNGGEIHLLSQKSPTVFQVILVV